MRIAALRDERRAAGVLVALATLVLYGVLVLWACVTPDYRAPDEPQQVSTTLRLAYAHSYPAAGDARIYPPVKASYADVGFGGIGLNTINGIVALKKPTAGQLTSASMRELAATSAGATTPYDYDQMTQHPPGYFAVMAVAARAFDVVDRTPRTAILILRLCSALLLLPLAWLTARIGRVLGLRPVVASCAAFLPAALPQLTHIAGAVNNDTLTITLAAAVTWLALETVVRPHARGWAVGLGAAMSALLLTKGTALPMLLVVAVAFAVRARRVGVRATLPDAAVSSLCMLPGLAWWAANLARYGTLQPDGYPKSYLDLLPHGTIAFGTWLSGFVAALTRSFFADFGWLESPPLPWVTVLATLGLLALLAAGLVRAPGRRGLVLVAQLSWVMPLVAILDTSHKASDRIGAIQGVQGRYLFAGVAAMAATVALAARPRRDAGARAFPVAALLPALAVVVAAVGLFSGVDHFYTGAGFGGRLGTLSSWSPLRLRVLAAVCAVVAAAAAVAVVAATRAMRPAPAGAAPDVADAPDVPPEEATADAEEPA